MDKKQVLKWWADKDEWQRIWGTKEIEIISVKLLDFSGRNIDNICINGCFTVKVEFHAREVVRNAHFGVAIFREQDGLYCFGPNTVLDGFKIDYINEGKGWFSIKFEGLPFTPETYQISTAIWDKKEFIPYSYHPGRYRLMVKGRQEKYAINAAHRFKLALLDFCIPLAAHRHGLDFGLIDENWKKELVSRDVKISHIELLDKHRKKKEFFETGESLMINVYSDFKTTLRDCCIWLGIFRKDRLYCHGASKRLGNAGKTTLSYPQVPLLNGDYFVSAGIFKRSTGKMLTLLHGIHGFKVMSRTDYHGLAYVRHKWEWRLP